MANPWFKFYAGEYLCDTKIKSLTPLERQCWTVLMCHANQADPEGVIRYLTEDQLMLDAGINPLDEDWKKTRGVLKKFEEKRMVTISNVTVTLLNWSKKQEVYSESYERVKKWREQKLGLTDSNGKKENKIKIKNKKYIYTPIFEEFWKLYPKKIGKPKAFEFWEKLEPSEHKEILQDIPKRIKEDDKWLNDFIKDPERYLKNRQWEDEIIKPRKKVEGKTHSY